MADSFNGDFLLIVVEDGKSTRYTQASFEYASFPGDAAYPEGGRCGSFGGMDLSWPALVKGVLMQRWEEDFERWHSRLLRSSMVAGHPPDHPLGSCVERDVVRDPLAKAALKGAYKKHVIDGDEAILSTED